MGTVARAIVTVDIQMSTYDKGWKIEDLVRQVREEAATKVANALRSSDVKVVGVPDVKIITTIEPGDK